MLLGQFKEGCFLRYRLDFQEMQTSTYFKLFISVYKFMQRREIHPPVHSNSSEREDWNIDRDRLDEEHQIARGSAKHPSMRIEGVGKSERDARHTHEHVREGQVPDEEVGDTVHLSGSAEDVEEQVVPEDAHHHHEHVAGDDERLELLQQGHICKLGAVIGGVALHSHLVNVSLHLCSWHRWLCASNQATLVLLHGSRAESVSSCNNIVMRKGYSIYNSI